MPYDAMNTSFQQGSLQAGGGGGSGTVWGVIMRHR